MSGPILVTGGSGFAGSYVIRALIEAGHRVVNYDIAPYRAESSFVIGDGASSVAYERGSIDDWPRVFEVVLAHGPQAIVHAGGMMDVRYLDEHPMVGLATNVGGTVNLLEAARLLGGVERFVLVSTVAVIGKKLYEPIDANHPTVSATAGPLGVYGAAKLAAEAFCLTYTANFALDVRIVRPSALYGFGMSWFAPNYMKNIVEPALLGEPVSLPTGGQVPRDYTYVVDFAALVAALLKAPADADRVFYGATGGELRTASEVAAIVRKLVPGSSIEIGDGWAEIDDQELPMRGRYDVENVRRGLGWKPRFANLEAGISDYIRLFRQFVAEGGVSTAPPAGLRGAPGLGS